MKQVIETNYDPAVVRTESSYLRRISWRAIFAGVIIAAIIQLLLTLLGVGIGAASVHPLQERAPGEGMAVGSVIWFFVSTIIAMYVGGRVAGGLSNCLAKKERMNQGLFAWAATTILSAVFLASVTGTLVGPVTGTAYGRNALQTQSIQSASTTAVSPGVTVTPQNERVAAKRVSETALATFFLLILGGIAAAIGGWSSALEVRQAERVEIGPETHGTPAFAK